MISRQLPRAWGFALLFALGAALTAPVGLDAQDKTKDKEKPKDPVGKVEVKPEPKTKVPPVEIQLDLKAMYMYEIEVTCVDIPVTMTLSAPKANQSTSEWAKRDSPNGPMTSAVKIKVFCTQKDAGKYTLTLGTSDDKKPLIDYSLTIKAVVSR